ncbi:hypothetical protein CEUSTIGMA_g8400.t1 [Chlamydomonas eustigma]|uniref:Uncharacterized protein n=1 Tax=Chlamydomonas eustigma TaxID=1157962 RepID=A0A250XD21_9CHLO|nr:hypothetical protein CEUSTIGMA_g8400.t1 [Chlamydomonas eustigma]|eukprot:GAX80965.1 hypothetical protein CEUSTIGMA_g8400.t1 [Chlamydomonas eustigma]
MLKPTLHSSSYVNNFYDMNVLTPIQEAQKVAAQGRHEAILTGPKAVLAAFSEIHRNSGWFVEALKPLKSEITSVKSSRSPPSDAQLPSAASGRDKSSKFLGNSLRHIPKTTLHMGTVSGVRKGPIRVLPERKLGVQTKIWHQQNSCDGSLLFRGLNHMGRRSLPASLQQARPQAGYALRHQLALLHQQHQQPEQQQAHNDIMANLPSPPPGIHHAHHQQSTSDNPHDSDSISTRSKKKSNACQDNLKPDEMTMLDEVVSIDAVLKEKQGKGACAVVHAHKLVGKETEKLDQRAGFKAADVSCHTTRSTQRVHNENTSKNKKSYKSSLSPRFRTPSSIQDSHLSVPSWVSSTSTNMVHPTVEQQNVLKALSRCPTTLHSVSTSEGSVILLTSLSYKDLIKSPELTAAGTGTTSMRPPSPLLTHDPPFLHKTLTLSNTHVCKPQLTNQLQQQAGGNHCPKALPRPRPGKTAGAAVNHKAVTGVDADCKGGHPHQCPPLNTAQGDTMTSNIMNYSKIEDPQGLVNITAMSGMASSDKQLSTPVVGTDGQLKTDGTMSNVAMQLVVPQLHAVQYIHDDALKMQKQSLSPLGALITVETDQGSSEADEALGKLAVHSAGAPQILMLNHEVQQQLKPQYSSKGRWWSWLLCGVFRSDKLSQAGKGDEAVPGAECQVTVSSDLGKLVSAPDFCKEAVPGEQLLAVDLSFIHMTAPGDEGCTSDPPSQQAAIISPEGPAQLLCPPDIAASKRIPLEAEPSSAHQKKEECNANSHRRFTASAALGTVSEISTPTSTAVLPSRRRITSHTCTPSASLSTINGVECITLYNRCPTDVLPSSLEDFINPSAANLILIPGHPAETEQSQPSTHIQGLHELPGESEDPNKGGLLTEGKAETKQAHEVQHEPKLSSDLPLPAFLHKVREALNASVKGHTSYPSPRTAGGILKDNTLDHFRHNLVEARSLVSSRSEGFSHIISPVKVYIEGRVPHSPRMILTGVPASAAHHSKSSSNILLSPRLGSTVDDRLRMNRPAVQLPSICSPRAPLLWRHGGSPSPGGHFPDKALYCPVNPATTASRQGRRCLSARERPSTAWRPSTVFVPSRLSEATGSTSYQVFTQAKPHTAAEHYLDAISIMPGKKTSLAVQLRTVLDALSPTRSDTNTAFHCLEGKDDDVREEGEEEDVQEGLLNKKEEAHTLSLPLKILTGHIPSSSDLPLKQLKTMLLKASGGSNDMLLKASLGSSNDISSSSSSGHVGLGKEVLQSQDDLTSAVHAVETSFVVPRASTLSMSDDQDNVKATYLKANRLSALLEEKLPVPVEESGCTAVLGGDTKGTVQQASLFKVPNHTKRNTAARPSSTGSYNISSLRPLKISGSYAAKAAAAALQSRPGGFSATLSATSNPVAEIAPPLQSSFHVVALDEALINDIDVEVTTADADFVQVNENQAEMECKASNFESTDFQPGSTQPGGSHDVPADCSTDKGTAFEGLDSSAPLQVPNHVSPFTAGKRMTIPTVMKSGLMSSQAALLQDNLIIDWSSSSLLQYQQALDHFSQVLDITFPQHSPFSTSTRSATSTPVPGSPSPDDDSRISSLYSSLFVAEHAAWKGTQSHLMQYSSTHSRSPVGQVMAKTAVRAESPSQAATRSPGVVLSKRTSGPHVNSTVNKCMDTNQHKSIRLGKGETRLPYDSTSTKGASSHVLPLSKDVGTRSPHCIQTRQNGAKPATASHPLLESNSCITHPVPPMMPPGACKPHYSLASRSTTYLPGSTAGVLNSLDVDHVLTTSGAKGSTFFSGVEHDRVSGSSTDSKVDLAELTRGTLAAIQAAEEAMRKVQERQLCIYPAGSACWRNSKRSSSMFSECHGEDESILFSREHQGGDSTVIGFSHMSLELLLPPPAFATSASDKSVDPAKDSSHVVSWEQDFKSSSHEQGSGLSSSCDGVPVVEEFPPLCSSDKMALKPSHAGLGSKENCSRIQAKSIHCSGKTCGVKESFVTSKATAVKASCVSGGGGDGGRTAAGACVMRITVDVMQED